MKKLLNFNSFINEKYEEDPEFRIKKFFDELEKNIKFWFDEGSFAANDAQLYDIKQNTSNNIEKYLMFDFQDEEFYYQVIFVVTLQEVEEDTLDDCHITVKKYDAENSELLRQLSKDVDIKELDEDTILELFAKLDEESDSMLGDDENEETLSDDDSELDDTDMI